MKCKRIINYRISIILILFLSQATVLFAQHDEICGSVASQEYINKLTSSLTERRATAEKYYKLRRATRTTGFSIPVQFHVSRNSSGEDPAVSNEDLLLVLDNLNDAFNPMDISFAACGQTKFIDNTLLHANFDKDIHDSQLDKYDDKYVLNIYFFGNLDGLNGYAKFPEDQVDRIVVEAENALTTTTIHEIGHYFSLLHTYSTSRGIELVSGANCRVAGDLICDTPPDPGDRDYYNNCVYVGNVRDPIGSLYSPDGFNYMGKGQNTCRNKFSPMQQERIIASVIMDRYYLVDCLQTKPEAGCHSTVTSFPYEESFENYTGGTDWRQNIDDQFGWSWGGNTRSDDTGPDNASKGDYFMFTEASDYRNAKGILTSPCFNLQGQNAAQISFAYHMFGVDIGKLELQLSQDQGSTWTSLWIEQGNKGNQWNEIDISLNDFLENTIQLRFIGETGSGSKGDMAIDNIVVSNQVLITGITGGRDKGKVTLYPNPARDILTIRYQDLDYGQYTLYITGIDGRIIYKSMFSASGNSGEYKVNLGQSDFGIYYVHIIGQSKKFTAAFVHQP